MSFVFSIPPPPSVNSAFRNVAGKGRVKTREYQAWRNNAVALLMGTVKARVAGPFSVAINLPWNMRGDIDNRVKGIIDALVSSGKVDDDRFMDSLHVHRTAEPPLAIVEVAAMDGALTKVREL